MSRSAADLIKTFRESRLRIFTTTDVRTLTGLKESAAAQALRRLSEKNLVAKLKRGVWTNELVNDLTPFEAVPFLTAPWPSYVSLYSALSEHGLVAEVPSICYAVSSGRPKNWRTSLGSFHIHHLPRELIWGYEMKRVGQATYPLADPEKAFLDQVYLALIPRSAIQLPIKRERRWNLDTKRLTSHAKRFHFSPLIAYLKEKKLWG